MPPLEKTRKDRRSKLEEYYRRNYENRTTAEIVDFMGGILAMDSYSNSFMNNGEVEEASFSFVDYMVPVIRDKNGKAVLDNDGKGQLDIVKLEQRMDEFADYAIQLRIEAAKEYKRQLKLIPENDEDRWKKAMFWTLESEAHFKYLNAVSNGALLIMKNRASDFKYNYNKKMKDLMASKYWKYYETLTKDEKEFFEKGSDAMQFEPDLLKGIKAEDVGLKEDELEAMRERSRKALAEKADFNWMLDNTMTAKPKYLSEQLSSDKNSRYGRYYMTLDEEGKRKFIFDGMLEKGNLKIYPEEKDPNGEIKPVKTYSDPVSVDCLSKKEKDVFRKACNVYFSPIEEDGSPDKDLFVERVDAVSNEIANLYKKHAEFVENEENFKGILDNPKDQAARTRAAKYISPFFKKITAYESEMQEIFGRNKVNKELKKHYIITKMNIEDKKGADD